MTLADCRDTHHQSGWAMNNIRNQDISALRVLTGVILSEADGAVFSGLAIELENLTEWDRHDEMTICGPNVGGV